MLIGIDGFEWDVLLPLLREGRLPNLERFMGQGVFGLLESSQPTLSPCIWTSIATGNTREKHGILGFLNREHEDTQSPTLYTSLDRKTKAFWNILSDHDQRSIVIGWWNTFPVEEIRGIMVAQTNTSTPEEASDTDKMLKGSLLMDLPGQVHPPQRSEGILSILPSIDAELPARTRRVFGRLPDTQDPIARQLWAKCLWAVRADAIYEAVARKLLKEEPDFDVMAIYFGGPDVFGHRFWRYFEPSAYDHPPSVEEVREFGDALSAYYRLMDEILGRLIDSAPKPCNFLVVSDHGMQAANTEREFRPDSSVRDLKSGGHPTAPPGFLLALGPDFRRAEAAQPREREDLESLGSVLDITPTLLALRGLPIGEDMDGRVLEHLLTPEYVQGAPTTYVPSHTPDGWMEGRHAGVAAPRERVDERIEQLRALGYMGDEE